MNLYIKNNILHIPIVKGVDFDLEFDSPDLDLSLYPIIRADFKPTMSLSAPPFIRLSIDDGISVSPAEENIPSTLSLHLSYSKTSGIKYPVLYMDIKGQIPGQSPVLLLSAVHNIVESTTDL